MSHFRKMLFALAAVASFFGVTGNANAQGSNPFVCNTSFSPLVVRVEGLRELVGDIVINCTGGNVVGPYYDSSSGNFTLAWPLANGVIASTRPNPASTPANPLPPLANLTTNQTANPAVVLSSTNSSIAPAINISVSVLGSRITNRIYSGTNLTDALLFIDDPTTPTAGTTRANQRLCTTTDPTTNQAGVCTTLNYFYENGFATGAGYVGSGPTNVFQGQYGIGGGFVPNDQTVTFVGVPVVQPGIAGTPAGNPGGNRTYRIKNIRVQVANTLMVGGQIQAFISIQNPPANLVLNNAQGVVGFVQRGLFFDTVSGGPYPQCIGLNYNTSSGAFYSTGTGSTGTTLGNNGFVRFTEAYGVAFKRRGYNNAALDAFDATYNQYFTPQGQANPTVNYNNESGFYNTAFDVNGPSYLTASTIGRASTGTRLRARFTGIPSQVRVYVTPVPVYGFGLGLTATSTTGTQYGQGLAAPGSAHLVSSVDANGANTSGSDGVSFNTSYVYNANGGVQGSQAPGWGGNGAAYKAVSSSNFQGVGAVNYYNAVTIASDGTGVAVWEVLRADDNVIDQLTFGVAIAFLPTTSIVTDANTTVTLNAAGNFAPIATTGGNAYPFVPSFILGTPEAPLPIATISNCATNLLYPFVTSVTGFNTGIAVANTSKDPFGTIQETGICRVFFYGTTTGGGIGDQVQPFTKSVPSGQVAVFNLLYGGPDYGIQPVAGFQGYVIISCNFRWAHGFAFISDPSNVLTAHGYLALILDIKTSANQRATGSNAESLDN